MADLTRRGFLGRFIGGSAGLALLLRSARGGGRLPAVGSDLLHWDGKRWRVVGQSQQQLLAVQVVNQRYGWAVGKNGALLHFDGNQWTPREGPAGDLHSISCRREGEAWIVGESIWRLEGKSWRRYDNPTEHSRTLFRVAFRNGEGWAAGVRGAMAHFDGRRWTSQPIPEVINAVRGLSIVGERLSPNIWAVGERGMILRSAGKGWQRVAGPADPAWAQNFLYDVHFLSPKNGWAVGAQGTIIRYDGHVWSLIDSPTGKFLLTVHFNGPDDGWAAGGNFPDGSVIIHYDGSKWTEVPSPTPRPIQDLCFVSPTNGWAVACAAKPVLVQR